MEGEKREERKNRLLNYLARDKHGLRELSNIVSELTHQERFLSKRTFQNYLFQLDFQLKEQITPVKN